MGAGWGVEGLQVGVEWVQGGGCHAVPCACEGWLVTRLPGPPALPPTLPPHPPPTHPPTHLTPLPFHQPTHPQLGGAAVRLRAARAAQGAAAKELLGALHGVLTGVQKARLNLIARPYFPDFMVRRGGVWGGWVGGVGRGGGERVVRARGCECGRGKGGGVSVGGGRGRGEFGRGKGEG